MLWLAVLNPAEKNGLRAMTPAEQYRNLTPPLQDKGDTQDILTSTVMQLASVYKTILATLLLLFVPQTCENVTSISLALGAPGYASAAGVRRSL